MPKPPTSTVVTVYIYPPGSPGGDWTVVDEPLDPADTETNGREVAAATREFWRHPGKHADRARAEIQTAYEHYGF